MGEKITGKANDIVLYLMRPDVDRSIVWDLEVHKDAKKRSLDSNAYFHVLCDKLRQKLGISMARCKNVLIADYGQCFYVNDEPMVYKTNAPEEYMMELETIHTKCVKVTKENDKDVFFYRVYRGSHTYNSSEMAALIKGTIEECELQNIPTATPDEIAHMQALWSKKYEKEQEHNSG
jgi:hypothetical protein